MTSHRPLSLPRTVTYPGGGATTAASLTNQLTAYEASQKEMVEHLKYLI